MFSFLQFYGDIIDKFFAVSVIDPLQQTEYRNWKKGEEIVASTIYGVSLSELFGPLIGEIQ
jgi:hypothetical protein